MNDLTIIIVSWNVKELLSKCLASLHSSVGVTPRVIVVDNDSADGTREILEHWQMQWAQLTVIFNSTNTGFAKANNQAILFERSLIAEGQWSTTPFVLLLNPDTSVAPDVLAQCIVEMQKDPRIGIAGPQLQNVDGTLQPSVRRFPSVRSQALIMTKLFLLFPRDTSLRQYWATDLDYTRSQDVDQIMGACFFIRRACLDAVGLLDEGFFVWFEEVDYCFRARSLDWRVRYLPINGVTHYGNQSFRQQLSVRRQLYYQRSLIYFFKKHFSLWQWWILWILQPIGLLLALIVSPLPRPQWLRRA